MKKIVWDDSFSVGIEELDKQHKQIVGVINRLIDEPKEGSIQTKSPRS